MDILYTWIDTGTQKERAKLYRNIDPDSITINTTTLCFAHPGAYTPGGNTAGMYQVPLIKNCAYFTSDPKQIEEYFYKKID